MSTSSRVSNLSELSFRTASEIFKEATMAYLIGLAGLAMHYIAPLFETNFHMILEVMAYLSAACLIFGYPVKGSCVPQRFYKMRFAIFCILVLSFVADCLRFYFIASFENTFFTNHLQLAAFVIFTITVWIYEPASLVKNQS